MAILDKQLEATGAFVTGNIFSLADFPLGLSVHRWNMTPFDRPALTAVAAEYDLLSQRPGYMQHGRNLLP